MPFEFYNGNFVFSSLDQDEESILYNLVDNGYGNIIDEKFVIPGECIYELSDGQRKLLNLPPEYHDHLRIDIEGIINKGDFKLVSQFTIDKEFGKYNVVKEDLPLVILRSINGINTKYLLSSNQFKVLKTIKEINNAENKSTIYSYNKLAELKSCKGADKKIVFCDYLDNYEVVTLSEVKLDIDYNNRILSVKPEIPDCIRNKYGIDAGAFTERFDKRNKILPIYTVNSKANKRNKIILPRKSEKELEDLKKKYRYIKDETLIKKIVDQPQMFFDTNLFDIKEFYSDRVIKIGLYKPSFYGFISPHKSRWIPGIEIIDKINGNSFIFLDSQKEIEEFEAAVNLAESLNRPYIEYKGYQFSLKTSKIILHNAKLQNNTPEHIIKLDPSAKKVLIIKDNAETLGYKVGELDLPQLSEYVLYEVENVLKDSITLKEHQRNGVAWLQYLFLNKSKGCILADDMGLGKTFQILYFICWHNWFKNKNKKPYLIVAPVSLLDNWEKEMKKFFKVGVFKPTILHKDKITINKNVNKKDIDWLKRQNIILTNYETVRNRQFSICAVDYAVIVLDEAQKIKSPGTYITCATKALKADFKIAMTGTPVENTFCDLWCIMDFAIPGLLGNLKDFSKFFQVPLKSKDTDIDELGKILRNRVGVFLLRRQKTDILKDLPKKTINKSYIAMPKIQEDTYVHAIKKYYKDSSAQNIFLKFLTELRKTSDSPYINSDDLESIEIDELVSSSAKILETIRILTHIKSKGEKAIIFCIYRESQRILQRVIGNKFGTIQE